MGGDIIDKLKNAIRITKCRKFINRSTNASRKISSKKRISV